MLLRTNNYNDLLKIITVMFMEIEVAIRAVQTTPCFNNYPILLKKKLLAKKLNKIGHRKYTIVPPKIPSFVTKFEVFTTIPQTWEYNGAHASISSALIGQGMKEYIDLKSKYVETIIVYRS